MTETIKNTQYNNGNSTPVSEVISNTKGLRVSRSTKHKSKEAERPYLKLAPCDKLWLRVAWHLDSEFLAEYRVHATTSTGSEKRLPFRFPYRVDSNFSSEYLLPNGAKVFIFRNEKKSEVQINPTQWTSWKVLETFIKLLIGDKESKRTKDVVVGRMHLHVDVPFSIEEIDRSLSAGRKRTAKKFLFAKKATKKSGKLSSVSYSKTFGSARTQEFEIYDSGAVHGFPNPTTRIERKDNGRASILIEHPLDLAFLCKTTPFNKVELKSLRTTHVLNRSDARKLEILALKAEKYGLDEAIKQERSHDPHHFSERFKRILPALKPMPIDLNAEFHLRLERFLNAPISTEDALMILKMKKSREVSRA